MRKIIAGITAGLVLTSCETNSVPPEIPEVLDDKRIASIHEISDANKQFWTQKGIGGIASIQLVILSGGQTFQCRMPKNEHLLSATSQTQYCVGNDAIVVTALSVNANYGVGLGKLGVDLSVSHEYGHAVQDLEARLDPLPEDSTARIDLELEATKYSGTFLATRYDTANINSAADYLRKTSPETHGGTLQADALLAGARR